jgi:hypothetical protein
MVAILPLEDASDLMCLLGTVHVTDQAARPARLPERPHCGSGIVGACPRGLVGCRGSAPGRCNPHPPNGARSPWCSGRNRACGG